MLFNRLGDTVKIIGSFAKFSKAAKEIEKAKKRGNLDEERALISAATYEWAIGLANTFNAELKITGQENIPDKDTPCVFIANHQGYADIVVMFIALRGHQFGFIAKDNFRNVPFLGKWITAIRGFFIKRGDARQALKTINDAGEYLKKGFSLAIFPEGTRSQGPEMGKFKAGSFKLATKNKVPVVPITIKGAYKIYEQQGYLKGDKVEVVIHEPIETAGISRKEAAELVEIVENTIKKELKRN